ncbi:MULTISPECIES: hypothetical protein [unclassified Neisseria]|uniref:hypothetical protein n=1 Tax=unclassified Neisseria TaxID=2623750 RepID=UPI0026660481|nr:MULTISPECIES: hypothetical protein [unclassified Neisseria]MDO1510911.1 hypothetical protein [Neisseria sp. MVDL19-042950]MDO1516866.1 hypothetical protein [Neisseria sp. MVDL18-041461]MDO1563922.1 hypothetical protein [Neisseria sp. MVDL20-010259]
MKNKFILSVLLAVFISYSYAEKGNEVTLTTDDKQIIFFPNSDCGNIRNTDLYYMKRGTDANIMLRKVWKKVRFNQNNSIENYTYSCVKAKKNKKVYTVNFVFNTKDRSQLTVIYPPNYKNAYGVHFTFECQFVAGAFANKEDIELKSILDKYLELDPRRKCVAAPVEDDNTLNSTDNQQDDLLEDYKNFGN